MESKRIKFVLQRTQDIIAYCEKYQEWVRQVKNPQSEKEKLSKKYYQWLQAHHYFNPDKPFSYEYVWMQDGTLIIDIFNRLENKYPYANSYNRKRSDYIIGLVQEIEEYCINYQKWPIEISHYKTKAEELSNRLARWLVSVGYTSNHENFKYTDLKDENNRSIVEILDALYKKYYTHQKTKEEHLINIVKAIIKYCQNYNEWPTATKNPTTLKEKLGNQLCTWLHKSHFYKPSLFKYSEVLYDNNISIQDILNLYCATYGSSIRARKDSYYTKLAEEIKDDTIFLLYSCIIKLFQCSLDYETYITYFNKTKEIITKYNIPLDFQNLFELNNYSLEERTIIFKERYHQYSLANGNDLAYLYHLLFTASQASIQNLARERKL